MSAHKIRGPYLPVGETEWTCSCGALAELRDPKKFGAETFSREDFFCPKEATR